MLNPLLIILRLIGFYHIHCTIHIHFHQLMDIIIEILGLFSFQDTGDGDILMELDVSFAIILHFIQLLLDGLMDHISHI